MQLGWLDGKDMNGMISNTNCELMELAKSPISLCVKGTMQITPAKNQDLWCSQPSFFHRSKKIWDKRLLWITKNKLLDLLELMHSEDAANVSTLYRRILQDIPRLKCKFPSSNDMKWLLKSIYILYKIYILYISDVCFLHTKCFLEDFSWSLSLRPLLPASRRKHEDKPT